MHHHNRLHIIIFLAGHSPQLWSFLCLPPLPLEQCSPAVLQSCSPCIALQAGSVSRHHPPRECVFSGMILKFSGLFRSEGIINVVVCSVSYDGDTADCLVTAVTRPDLVSNEEWDRRVIQVLTGYSISIKQIKFKHSNATKDDQSRIIKYEVLFEIF